MYDGNVLLIHVGSIYLLREGSMNSLNAHLCPVPRVLGVEDSCSSNRRPQMEATMLNTMASRPISFDIHVQL